MNRDSVLVLTYPLKSQQSDIALDVDGRVMTVAAEPW